MITSHAFNRRTLPFVASCFRSIGKNVKDSAPSPCADRTIVAEGLEVRRVLST